MHSYMNGLTIDDNGLAFDAIKEVGPAHHFLDSEHTMRNYKTAFWESTLNDDRPYETWEETGKVDALTRANQAWKKVLAEFEAPAMDQATDEALIEFMNKKKQSAPDAWH